MDSLTNADRYLDTRPHTNDGRFPRHHHEVALLGGNTESDAVRRGIVTDPAFLNGGSSARTIYRTSS